MDKRNIIASRSLAAGDIFSNGLELVQYLASPGKDKYYPCCIIVNIAMPVWDGIKTLTALKKEAGWKNIPVVMLGTPEQKKDAELALKMGAEQVINKPVPAETLKQTFEISCRKQPARKMTNRAPLHS